jgi:hypothetical protein
MDEDQWKIAVVGILLLFAAMGVGILFLENCT